MIDSWVCFSVLKCGKIVKKYINCVVDDVLKMMIFIFCIFFVLELKIIFSVNKIKFLGLWKLLLVKLVFEKFGDGFEVVCLIKKFLMLLKVIV